MSSVAHSLIFLLGLILSVAIPFWLIGFVSRSLSSWMASRAAAKLLAMPPDSPRARLDLESRFVAQMTECDVSATAMTVLSKRCAGTTSKGSTYSPTATAPVPPDFSGCSLALEPQAAAFPKGATRDAELLARLQKFPGFNNQAFIEDMGSTQEALFTCLGEGCLKNLPMLRCEAVNHLSRLARTYTNLVLILHVLPESYVLGHHPSLRFLDGHPFGWKIHDGLCFSVKGA